MAAKRLRAIAFACLGIALGFGASTPPAPDQDPFVGTWRANREKSYPRLDRKDADDVFTVARQGDDLIWSSYNGHTRRQRDYSIRCDGKFHLTPTGPLVSCEYTSPDTTVGVTREPTGKLDCWTRHVSADRQEMTITSFKDELRTKVKAVWVFDRVK